MTPRPKRYRNDDGRRIRLAKVHIAKKDLGLSDELYRMILREEFGVESAANLSEGELDSLIERFESKGWRPKPISNLKSEISNRQGAQAEALKERIGQVLLGSSLTPARFRRLLYKYACVEDLKWCNDVDKLKRVLVILTRISGESECCN